MASRDKMRKRRQSEWPWERAMSRESATSDDRHYVSNYDRKLPKFYSVSYDNLYLDMSTKRTALKSSASVVSLVSYSDDNQVFQGSGTIIDVVGIILTSATLIRSIGTENFVANKFKIVVYLSDERSFVAKVIAYDFHFNLAVVKIDVDFQLPAACLRTLHDALSMEESNVDKTGFRLHRHSSAFTLSPGDKVVALGRHFTKPYDFMAAPGEFSIRRIGSNYDCKELFRASCQITTTGIGGPLVNHRGEVIGINFYEVGFTPFIPINVALKWWDHYKQFRELRRPLLEMNLINLYAVKLQKMEKLIQKLPTNSSGVFVETVTKGSSAYKAGILINDLIIQCAGKTVKGFLEFFDVVWENAGHSVELVVVRASEDAPLNLNMVVADATQDQFYSWPVCKDLF